jgi:hypothetical protein
LTSHSYLYGTELKRVSTRKIQEEQLKLSVQRMRNEMMYQNANALPSTSEAANAPSATTEMAAAQAAESRAEQQLLNQLANTAPTGRIALGIKADAKSVEDIPGLAMEDGDDLLIPAVIGTVQVTGEVYNPNSLRYQPKKRLISYLNESGGPNREADAKRMFVIRADGTVVSRQSHHQYFGAHFEDMALMPGDAIVVPPKLRSHNAFMQNLPSITQILSQTAMMGAVISLLK